MRSICFEEQTNIVVYLANALMMHLLVMGFAIVVTDLTKRRYYVKKSRELDLKLHYIIRINNVCSKNMY